MNNTQNSERAFEFKKHSTPYIRPKTAIQGNVSLIRRISQYSGRPVTILRKDEFPHDHLKTNHEEIRKEIMKLTVQPKKNSVRSIRAQKDIYGLIKMKNDAVMAS